MQRRVCDALLLQPAFVIDKHSQLTNYQIHSQIRRPRGQNTFQQCFKWQRINQRHALLTQTSQLHMSTGFMHNLACLRLNTAGTGTQLTWEYPRLTTIQIPSLSSPIGEKQAATTRGTSCVGKQGCHIGSSLFTSSCLKPRDDLNHSTGAVNLQYLCTIRLKYCSVGTMGNSDVVGACSANAFINYYFVNLAVFKSSTASCFMHFSGLLPPPPFSALERYVMFLWQRTTQEHHVTECWEDKQTEKERLLESHQSGA